MITYEWLKSVCQPDTARLVGKNPWAFHDAKSDAWWTCATDGRAVIYIPGRIERVAECPPNVAKIIGTFLHLDVPEAADLSLSDLRDWCGAYDPPVTCHKCDGEGYVIPDDEDGDDCWCQECNGEGGWGGDPRYGVLLGVDIDRNLLAKFLVEVDGGRVKVVPRGDTKPMSLMGEGWSIAVMPVTHSSGRPADTPVFAAYKTVWGGV